MPYTVKVEKTFDQSFTNTYKSLYLSVKLLKGKILVNKPEKKRLEAQMDKTLYGVVLGDRSRFEIDFVEESENQTKLLITAYPVNPIGQKLMFGARKGVIPKVMDALFNEMEKKFEAE